MLWPPEGSPDALVLEHAPALIAYLDTELRYRFANRRYGGVVGAEPEEIVGKRVADVTARVGCRARDARRCAVARQALLGHRLGRRRRLLRRIRRAHDRAGP